MKRIQWLAIAYSSLILIIIYMADLGSPLLRVIHAIPYGDKIGHFVLIGGLTLLINLAVNCHRISVGRLKFLTASLVIVVLITLEEFSQLFVASRHFDLGDLAANYLGIVFCSWLAVWWQQRQIQEADTATVNAES